MTKCQLPTLNRPFLQAFRKNFDWVQRMSLCTFHWTGHCEIWEFFAIEYTLQFFVEAWHTLEAGESHLGFSCWCLFEVEESVKLVGGSEVLNFTWSLAAGQAEIALSSFGGDETSGPKKEWTTRSHGILKIGSHLRYNSMLCLNKIRHMCILYIRMQNFQESRGWLHRC